MLLENGSLAPIVELPGDAGQFYNLNDYRGKKIILYFYPKDDTSGCTAQACAFRDQLEDFNNLDVAVFGISRDTPQSHDKFKSKYKLTFPLLSDVDGVVCAAYGTWVEKSMYGKSILVLNGLPSSLMKKELSATFGAKLKLPVTLKTF